MHGQQLHRVGGRGCRDVEAVALVVLGGEVGEQRGQRHVAVDGLEVSDRADEEVQVVAPGRRGRAHGRGELDVGAGGVDDPPDDVEERLADVGAQPAQLAAQQAEPLQRLGRVRAVARVGEGVVEARDLGRVDAVGDLDEVGGDRRRARAPAPAPAELGGTPTQQAEVARPDRPPGAGEQGQQRRVRGHVVHQPQGRHDLRDLGQPEQPGEPDDLDGDVGVGQRVEHLGRVRVVARQHADPRPRALGGPVVRRSHPVDERGQLVDVGLVDGGRHHADERTVLRVEALHGVERVVQRSGQAVGGLEDAPVGASVHRQRVRRHRPGRARERLREVEDVADGGTAPAVDGLVRVADRGHRVPVAEQPGQHDRLRDRGVLVLVEQHDPELLALGRPHLRLLRGEPRTELDLVGEVHEPEVRLEPPVGRDQPEQLAAPVDGAHRVGDRREVGLAVLVRLLDGVGAQEGLPLG